MKVFIIMRATNEPMLKTDVPIKVLSSREKAEQWIKNHKEDDVRYWLEEFEVEDE